MRAPLLALLLALSFSPAEAEDETAFDRLGTLVGAWDGEFTWSGSAWTFNRNDIAKESKTRYDNIEHLESCLEVRLASG